jgi:hypothetical protein
MLTDLKLASGLTKRVRQLGESMQQEAVGHEHQVTVAPMLADQQEVLNQVWIQQRFAAEKGEAFGTQAMGPLRVLGVCLIDGRHRPGEVIVCVVTALLTREVATVSKVVLERREFNHRHVTRSN